ncbi:MAG: alpha/beta hydrolase [Methylococcales bacterium]|nr:alpha/beta hydrolase [Methylococcales bacterium]
MANQTAFGLKRFLQSGLIMVVGLALALLILFRPASVNLLEYLLWKTTTDARTETGFVLDKGAYIHYVAYGVGYPVLLLHGGGNDKLGWFSQIPWLVASGHKVVTLDTREQSQTAGGDADASYGLLAEDALKVLDKLDIKRTDIIGWSTGGVTALYLDLAAPGRVGRIVAISANYHPAASASLASEAENQTLRSRLFNWIFSFWLTPNSGYPELGKELHHLWQTRMQPAQGDARPMQVPTLFIADENDLGAEIRSGELGQLLPYGNIEIIPDAGHAAPVSHARQVNDLIAAFLGIEMSE